MVKSVANVRARLSGRDMIGTVRMRMGTYGARIYYVVIVSSSSIEET